MRLFAESDVDELSLDKILVAFIDCFDFASKIYLGGASEEILVEIEVGVQSSTSALVPFLVNLVEVLFDHIADALVIFVAFWRDKILIITSLLSRALLIAHSSLCNNNVHKRDRMPKLSGSSSINFWSD